MSIKVITGKVRASFVHVFEPAAINGGEPKYSCSLIIPKSDTVTMNWAFRYRELLRNADQIVLMCSNYQRGCYHMRNRYMVLCKASHNTIYEKQIVM